MFDLEEMRKLIKKYNSTSGLGFLPFSKGQQEIYMARNLFFYHIKNETDIIESLYNKIFPNFKKIIKPYKKWHYNEFKYKPETIRWGKLLHFFISRNNKTKTYFKVFNNIIKWTKKNNLVDPWIIDSITVNMYFWDKYPKHKKNKTLYYIDTKYFFDGKIYKEGLSAVKKYIGMTKMLNDAMGIDEKPTEFLLYPPDIPPYNPQAYTIGDYKKMANKIINEYVDLWNNDMKNKGFSKTKKMTSSKYKPEFDSNFKWLVEYQINGKTRQKILEELQFEWGRKLEDKIEKYEDKMDNFTNADYIGETVRNTATTINLTLKSNIPTVYPEMKKPKLEEASIWKK